MTPARFPAAAVVRPRCEAVILAAAGGGGFDVDDLKRAMTGSAEIH